MLSRVDPSIQACNGATIRPLKVLSRLGFLGRGNTYRSGLLAHNLASAMTESPERLAGEWFASTSRSSLCEVHTIAGHLTRD
jgi:hypothetical protein